MILNDHVGSDSSTHVSTGVLSSARQDRPRPRYECTTLDKALTVLDILASENKPWSLLAICDATGLNKTTTFRLLQVMEERGYVTRARGGYALGYHIYQMSLHLSEQPILRRICRPYLEELHSSLGGATHLGFSAGRQVVCGDKIGGSSSPRLQIRVGEKLDAHSTAMGKSLLAFMSDAELKTLFRNGQTLSARTVRTASRFVDFIRMIDDVRRQRIAINDQEYQDGVWCAAAAVLDENKRPLCAISVSYDVAHDRPSLPDIRSALLNYSSQIGERFRRSKC